MADPLSRDNLPSVEHIDSSKQTWDTGSSQSEQLSRPSIIRSMDAPSSSHEVRWSGVDNVAFEGNDEGPREARYNHGKYSSYEEILKNMADQDPFNQETPPPPNQDLVRKSRELKLDRQRTKESLTNKSTSSSRNSKIPQPKNGGRKEPKQRNNTKKSEIKKNKKNLDDAKPVEDLEGTYTILKDNPAYEMYKPRRRKPSQDSTGTFIVSKSGRGDKQKLVQEADPIEPSAAVLSDTIKGLKVIAEDNGGLHELHQTAETPSQKSPSQDVSQKHNSAQLLRQDTGFSNVLGLWSRTTTGPNLQRQENIRQYVQSNIQMRQCAKYIKNTANSEEAAQKNCCCGRDLDWHEEEGMDTTTPAQEPWKRSEHTRTLPCSCYGTICFQGFGQEASKSAPFVRIDQDTKPETIWTLFHDLWKVPKPRLIISVTGGAKRFFLKNRLKTSFKRGLVNVATTTGAWIITGGTNAGVMEFVGEAVKEHTLTAAATEQKIVALGIATWGIVDNLEALENEASFVKTYRSNDLSPKSVRGKSPLDFNHTHFILVDNGMERKFGAEIQFRAAFENYIANMETEVARNQQVKVPVVMLVLEGGINTIKTAREALENNTPVVIIHGSGRAADVIAYAVKYFKAKPEGQIAFAPDKFDQPPREEHAKAYTDILEKVCDWLDWSREKKSEEVQKNPKILEKQQFQVLKNIESMLQKRQFLTVYFLDDVDSTNEIDQAILYALLKAKKSEFLQQLNLALAWNRCDIARQEIFKNENRQEWQDKMPALHDAMFTALIQNRIDFVKLFLDNGVELKDFLNVRMLRELYDEVVNDPQANNCAHLLLHMLQREQSAWHGCCKREYWTDDLPNLLHLVGRLINSMTGEQYMDLYEGKKYLVTEETRTAYKTKDDIAMTTMNTLGNTTSRSLMKRSSRYRKPEPDFPMPEKDLLFWAILLNRQELALLFWKLGKDHIGGALTTSSIFKELADRASAEEELDLSNELNANAEEFETLAVGVLNECYQRNKIISHQLLVRTLRTWGNSTVLGMADTGTHMSLMGHSSSQTKLNKIWKGRMALYTSVWKIVAGLLFFPFIVPTIRFTTRDLDDVSSLGIFHKDVDNQVSPSDDAKDHHGNKMGSGNKGPKLYKVEANSCCTDNNSIGFCQAILLFHTAPLVKFCYHTLMYVIFLGLFCFFVLTDLKPMSAGGPSVYEYMVWGWAGTMLLEEIRQLIARDPRTFASKVASYFSSVWNRFDVAVYTLLGLCIALRLTLPDNQFVWARRFYAINVTMFFLRFMHTFYVEKNMGPKVIMINKMLVDLLFFILILAVFVLGYGVAAQALRFPNSEPSWKLIRDVLYMPYFHIYGELFLEEINGDIEGCQGPTPGPECPEKSWLVMVLLAMYMIIINVLLLNLLIAMFSHTFSNVQENSEKVWRFYRYGLIYEYFDKPTFAPPLIIISHIWRIIKFIKRSCRHQRKLDNDFHKHLSDEDYNKLTTFERASMENFLRQKHLLSREHIDAKVSTAGERIEKVIEDLEQIKETVVTPGDTVATLVSSNAPESANTRIMDDPRERQNIGVLQSRISGLQDQLEEQREQMRHMSRILEKMSSQMVTQNIENSPIRSTTVMRLHAPPPPDSPQTWGDARPQKIEVDETPQDRASVETQAEDIDHREHRHRDHKHRSKRHRSEHRRSENQRSENQRPDSPRSERQDLMVEGHQFQGPTPRRSDRSDEQISDSQGSQRLRTGLRDQRKRHEALDYRSHWDDYGLAPGVPQIEIQDLPGNQ